MMEGTLNMRLMAKKKPATGRARERGLTVEVGTQVSREHFEALKACMADTRRTKRAVVELALEKYLGELGFWPHAEE